MKTGKRGKLTGQRDFVLVRISSLLKNGIGENLAIPINRKFLETLGLINTEITELDIPKVEVLQEPAKIDEKIQFSVH